MAQSYSHCWELYDNACGYLRAKEDPKERLRKALREISIAKEEQVAPEVKSNWQAVRDKIATAPDHPEGRIYSYVESLSAAQINALQAEIRRDLSVLERKYR